MLFHSEDIRHCLRSRRKVNKCESFYDPHFWGGTIPTFYSILFAQFIVHRLAKLFKFRFIDVYFYGSVYWSTSAKSGNEVGYTFMYTVDQKSGPPTDGDSISGTCGLYLVYCCRPRSATCQAMRSLRIVVLLPWCSSVCRCMDPCTTGSTGVHGRCVWDRRALWPFGALQRGFKFMSNVLGTLAPKHVHIVLTVFSSFTWKRGGVWMNAN